MGTVKSDDVWRTTAAIEQRLNAGAHTARSSDEAAAQASLYSVARSPRHHVAVAVGLTPPMSALDFGWIMMAFTDPTPLTSLRSS